MRTQIFRTPPVLVDNAAGVVVFTKDVDGAVPLDLYLENLGARASLRTKFGSKNANLVYRAKAYGTAGNALKVKYVAAAASQAFAVAYAASLLTVTLKTDAATLSDGSPVVSQSPVNLASAIMGAVNKLVGADLVAELAPGSDGSAVPGALAETALAGGAAAADLGDVTVEHSPTGARERREEDSAVAQFPGPWLVLNTAVFSGLTADSAAVLSVGFDAPVRGLRMTAKKAKSATRRKAR